MRILVAEDERNLNRILTEALTDEGYSVDPCFDGQEAWDALACAEYDVLVLDIMMPRMDGLTLVRKLRESGSTTPVLFLTSRDSVEDKVEGLATGKTGERSVAATFRDNLTGVIPTSQIRVENIALQKR